MKDKTGTKLKCNMPEIHLLGEIVVAFGNLELFLEVVIWQLLGVEEQNRNIMAQIITSEMSFDRKVHAFVNMFKENEPDQAEDDLKALTKDLFAVQAERNALLHSAWNYSEKFGGLYRMKASAKASKGMNRRIYPMPVQRLEGVRGRIQAVGETLARFAMAHIQKKANESE